jgi:undecaprenyl-diphosphatase
MFDVVIQLGAILAVMVYFRKKIFVFNQENFNLWKKVVVGVLPAIVIGGLVGWWVEERLFSPLIVSLALVVGGVVILLVEKRHKTYDIGLMTMTYKLALVIGFIQCIAMIPGVSRSGATIVGAMLLGLTRVAAAEFSFFLAIPTMLAASVYSLLHFQGSLSNTETGLLLTGFVFAFLSAWLVVKAFVKFISTHTFKLFGWYRIFLGAIVMILLFL